MTIQANEAEIAAVSRRLTKAQRATVLTAPEESAALWRDYWKSTNASTARSLFCLGLVDTSDPLAKPTVLGLAVRAYLENNLDRQEEIAP